MTTCFGILKNGNSCSYKSKYVWEEYTPYYFCAQHIISEVNRHMNTSYSTIEEIPNARIVSKQPMLSQAQISQIVEHIHEAHGYNIRTTEIIRKKNHYEIMAVDLNAESDIEQSLMLYVQRRYISVAIDASSTYASILHSITKPLVVPIISYEQTFNGQTHICLARGFNPEWYYHLQRIAYPMLPIDSQTMELKLVSNLTNLIHIMHSHKFVKGSIDIDCLVQLMPKRISSIVFPSMHNMMPRVSRTGITISEDTPLDSDIRFNIQTCAMRMNEKLFPCRYDDIESMLYFIWLITKKTLPWMELSDHTAIAKEKRIFLSNLSQSKTAYGKIAETIMDAHYDDRPSYGMIRQLFEAAINETHG